MYFALTPSCLMAGGKLCAVYQSSSVKVWFIAYADFLLNWKPFYYLIDMGVSLGVEVDLGIFSIRIHLGAQLHLWGPEFAGLVQIDLTVITLTAVSYTHLDVYKRQLSGRADQHQRQLLAAVSYTHLDVYKRQV